MHFESLLKDQLFFSKVRDFLQVEKRWNVYVVGGFVRDLILQEENKDIDLVVTGVDRINDGIGFAQELAKFLNVKSVTVFENFGTANFVYNDTEIEIVGARKESYERGSRKPIVEDGTLLDDLSRRDFTFNAMAISLNVDNFGELIDIFRGLRDLNDGVIKTPLSADITFSDDPLRMLRAIRFSARFGFEIEQYTYDSIKNNAERLKIISNERIVQEVNKILLSKNPSLGIQKLHQVKLLNKFLPELAALDIVEERNKVLHKNNFLHTAQVVQQTRAVSSDIIVLWAALLHDIGKHRTKRFDTGWTFHNHEEVGAKMLQGILTRLKMPVNEWMPKIFCIVKYHGKVKELALDEKSDTQISDSAIRRLVVETGEHLEDLLKFAKCDTTTKHEEKRNRYLSNYARLEIRIAEVAEKDNLRNFKNPITGEEIMETFNLKPSKAVGQIKDAVKDAIMDGIIPNEVESARQYMLKIASNFVTI
jgi:poly(A) polymerase